MHLTEVANLAHDVTDATERFPNPLECLAPLLRGPFLGREEELDVGGGRHQRVVDAVVQCHGHLADRGQALGTHQVVLGGHQRLAQLPVAPYALQDFREYLLERGVLREVIVRSPAKSGGGE